MNNVKLYAWMNSVKLCVLVLLIAYVFCCLVIHNDVGYYIVIIGIYGLY